MENLNVAVESNLYDCIEGEFKVPVELTYPDGSIQTLSENDPTELLGGMLRNFTVRENMETGEPVVTHQPVLTLRRSSLSQEIKAGANLMVKVPITPGGDPSLSLLATTDRSPEDGSDLGFIRLYLQQAEQS
jgi:hypothetical protein